MVSVHERNRAKILQILFLHAPISRIEMAGIMSLSPPAITSNINSLMKAGIIAELAGATGEKSALGRKPVLLDIVPSSLYALGADWGPTGIICTLTDLRGHQIGRVKTANKAWSPAATVSRTVKAVNALIERHGIPREKVLGLGVGIPGFVEAETGLVRYSPAHGWQNLDVGKPLREKLGISVVIENNVRAMAAAEMLFIRRSAGRSPATGNFLFIFVGQGIACAIVNNDELLRGNVFGAGELGHTTVALDGPPCRCGKRGCLEAIAGEFAITNRVIKLLAGGGSTLLRQAVKDPEAPEVGEILAAYDQGDRETGEILSECVEYLGLGVANVINLINPQRVIFEGRLFGSAALRDRLREAVNSHTFALMKSETEYEFRTYNVDSCSRGAAACVIRRFLL
jgi:predicted NBD/HSP70 family sugar kinase